MQAAAVTGAQLVVHWVLTSPTQHPDLKVASAAAVGSTAGAALAVDDADRPGDPGMQAAAVTGSTTGRALGSDVADTASDLQW